MDLQGPGCGFTALRPKRDGVNERSEAGGKQISGCPPLEHFQLSNSPACWQEGSVSEQCRSQSSWQASRPTNGLGLADEP